MPSPTCALEHFECQRERVTCTQLTCDYSHVCQPSGSLFELTRARIIKRSNRDQGDSVPAAPSSPSRHKHQENGSRFLTPRLTDGGI